MRMWDIPPEMLCNQHLLGEHLELHMFVGAIKAGTSLTGYIRDGLVETGRLQERHDLLVGEMLDRGMRHESPLDQPSIEPQGHINRQKNVLDLCLRCESCQRRILNAPAEIHHRLNREPV